jgi:hypothetical protein
MDHLTSKNPFIHASNEPSVKSMVKNSVPFRVLRDHKSRRDRLSLGTIIVAALGRQFLGLSSATVQRFNDSPLATLSVTQKRIDCGAHL